MGNACSFDGNNNYYIQIEHDVSFERLSEGSLVFWIKSTNINDFGSICYKNKGGQYIGDFDLSIKNNKLFYGISNETTDIYGRESSKLNNDNWNLIGINWKIINSKTLISYILNENIDNTYLEDDMFLF